MTALLVTFRRAYHHAHADPGILDDPLAALLLTPEDRQRIESIVIERFCPDLAGAGGDRAGALALAMQRSHNAAGSIVLTRARYTEDRLAEAMRGGLAQYVLIGAGLDTFAFRRPDLGDRLQVFEIDHPATQAFKRERLAKAGFAPPPHLHFAPADLERESVDAVLARLPYDATRPALFAWLGVLPYLTREAISETLRSIRRAAASGSELVFDYGDTASRRPENRSAGLRSVHEMTEGMGEPLISGFDPAELGSELSRFGFELIEDLGPKEQEARFFEGQADGLHAAEFIHVARARVP
jgi:methyltransferase (TIGR00027 family)